ncbi:MAG TPA: glycosyltransferase family 2 protein [Usitatibacter sp.]|nr:glycosyltransferase family 2 protein [Usitatibacter sp.]
MRCAVIVTTYNRPDALAAVLEGYLAQTDLDFELVVADDGSTSDSRTVVESYQKRAPFPIRHVWHEDQGFRAAAIRNRAVAATTADYIVFTDGDCIAPAHFVAAHKRLAERGHFLSGNRMLLTEAFTREVLESKLPVQRWSNFRWLGARLRGRINRWLPLLTLPDGAFRRRVGQGWEGHKTCNLSLWRDDLVKVNGVDESFSGWGLEDSDLVIRLYRAGVRHKSARFAAPVFHLWHRENDRASLAENQRRLDELMGSGRVRAVQGLDRY